MLKLVFQNELKKFKIDAKGTSYVHKKSSGYDLRKKTYFFFNPKFSYTLFEISDKPYFLPKFS